VAAPRRVKPLARVRKICLALPEAHEKIAWGAPTFRVKNKQFAMYLDDHHGDGRLALWCKAAPGAQEELVGSDPKRFFVPPYVGKAGWVGIHLDKGLDWGVIAGLLREGYLEIAPKKLRDVAEGRERVTTARMGRR
jgi:predicted DNA-binding protein (MmcQ/YjbR family)